MEHPEHKQLADMSLSEVAARTLDVAQTAISEAGSARSVEDLADIFLAGDRKIFSGLLLLLITVVLILFVT